MADAQKINNSDNIIDSRDLMKAAEEIEETLNGLMLDYREAYEDVEDFKHAKARGDITLSPDDNESELEDLEETRDDRLDDLAEWLEINDSEKDFLGDCVIGDKLDVADLFRKHPELCDHDDAEACRHLWLFHDEIKDECSDYRHGETLINESYFESYARELASDLYGKEVDEACWPFTCIDWEEAADQLKMDYSQAEFDGTTYYFRS